MLTELRHIIFPSSDLMDVLKRRELLDVSSQDLRVDNIDYETIELAFSHDVGETLQKVALDTGLVLRAVVRYCLDEGIPIPRHAPKTLEMVDGQLALQIRIDPQIRSEQESKYYVLL